MASQLSDALERVALIRESANRGDWQGATDLTALLPREPVAASREELGEYLRCLQEAVTVAKASRAHAASSLLRLQAVARFNRARLEFPSDRQNSDDPADF
jgi:hypothetical protein